ncbi:glyoxalase superfamily protein [Pedobacter sp. KR3-3]|uniref:Glyoxalase superfamily protein n=1 Tax=Pedobacter albus TaxID=3113905 RepID=A0ABU7IB92_9SPHI|nr:glyoxalase superfamily protein [Pedobacter sp. KR3-3]MEE1946624.1 glyoxalase superfamily protein [Pedobacter sp. KR3-3]
MKALSLTAIIHVTDLNKALDYYKDVLGFKVDFEFGEYVGLNYDDVALHLNGVTNHGIKKAPGSAHFAIDCSEVDAYYDLISKQGAIITVPIADRAYGLRDFAVEDPDGNTLVFGKAIV